eukprot:gnl/Chilomastix_cuspidata/5224.p1 GENE.gnl/Chilomastix_cuspidata/5224~~gnl/Chilomastix_cuspidata/5224.p1  ORF type:complete len:2054 (-),score=44.48 gnl/Chilomastix_cuspidata/5224:8-5908(-)
MDSFPDVYWKDKLKRLIHHNTSEYKVRSLVTRNMRQRVWKNWRSSVSWNVAIPRNLEHHPPFPVVPPRRESGVSPYNVLPPRHRRTLKHRDHDPFIVHRASRIRSRLLLLSTAERLKTAQQPGSTLSNRVASPLLAAWSRLARRVSPPPPLLHAIAAAASRRRREGILGAPLTRGGFPPTLLNPACVLRWLLLDMPTTRRSAAQMLSPRPRLHPDVTLGRPVDLRRFRVATRAVQRTFLAASLRAWQARALDTRRRLNLHNKTRVLATAWKAFLHIHKNLAREKQLRGLRETRELHLFFSAWRSPPQSTVQLRAAERQVMKRTIGFVLSGAFAAVVQSARAALARKRAHERLMFSFQNSPWRRRRALNAWRDALALRLRECTLRERIQAHQRANQRYNIFVLWRELTLCCALTESRVVQLHRQRLFYTWRSRLALREGTYRIGRALATSTTLNCQRKYFACLKRALRVSDLARVIAGRHIHQIRHTVLRAWRAQHRRRMKCHRSGARAQRIWARYTLSDSYDAWRRALKLRRAIAWRLRQVRMAVRSRALALTWRTWRAVTVQRARGIAQLAHTLNLSIESVKRNTLIAWHAYAAEHSRKRQLSGMIERARFQRIARRTLTNWETAYTIKRASTFVERRHSVVLLRNSLLTLSRFASQTRPGRSARLARARQRRVELKAHIFFSWQKRSNALQHAATAVRRTTTMREKKTLFSFLRKLSRCFQIERSILLQTRRAQASALVALWLHAAVRRRSAQIAFSNLHRLKTKQTYSEIFWRWHKRASQVRAGKLLAQVRQDRLVRPPFSNWLRYVRYRKWKVSAIEIVRTQAAELSRDALVFAKLFCVTSGHVQPCGRNALLSYRAMYNWFANARQKAATRRRLEDARRYHQALLCKKGIFAFAANTAHARSARASIEHRRLCLSGRALSGWRLALQIRIRLISQHREVSLLYRRRSLRRGIRAWRSAAIRRTSAGRKETQLERSRVAAKRMHIFEEWKHVSLQVRRFRVVSAIARQRQEFIETQRFFSYWRSSFRVLCVERDVATRLREEIARGHIKYTFQKWKTWSTRRILERRAVASMQYSRGLRGRKAVLGVLCNEHHLRTLQRKAEADARNFYDKKLRGDVFRLWGRAAAQSSLARLRFEVAARFEERRIKRFWFHLFMPAIGRRASIYCEVLNRRRKSSGALFQRVFRHWAAAGRGRALRRRVFMGEQTTAFELLRQKLEKINEDQQACRNLILAKNVALVRKTFLHAVEVRDAREVQRAEAARALAFAFTRILLSRCFKRWSQRRVENRLGRYLASKRKSYMERIFDNWRVYTRTLDSLRMGPGKRLKALADNSRQIRGLRAWLRVFQRRKFEAFVRKHETLRTVKAFSALIAFSGTIVSNLARAAEFHERVQARRCFRIIQHAHLDKKCEAFSRRKCAAAKAKAFLRWTNATQGRRERQQLERDRMFSEDRRSALSRFIVLQNSRYRAKQILALLRAFQWWRACAILRRAQGQASLSRAMCAIREVIGHIREERARALKVRAALASSQASRTLEAWHTYTQRVLTTRAAILRREHQRKVAQQISEFARISRLRSCYQALAHRRTRNNTLKTRAEHFADARVRRAVFRHLVSVATTCFRHRSRSEKIARRVNRRKRRTALKAFQQKQRAIHEKQDLAREFRESRLFTQIFGYINLVARAAFVSRAHKIRIQRRVFCALNEFHEELLVRARRADRAHKTTQNQQIFFFLKTAHTKKITQREETEDMLLQQRWRLSRARTLQAWRRALRAKRARSDNVQHLAQVLSRTAGPYRARLSFLRWAEQVRARKLLRYRLEKWQRAQARRALRTWSFCAHARVMHRAAMKDAGVQRKKALLSKSLNIWKQRFASSHYPARQPHPGALAMFPPDVQSLVRARLEAQPPPPPENSSPSSERFVVETPLPSSLREHTTMHLTPEERKRRRSKDAHISWRLPDAPQPQRGAARGE